MHFDRSAALGFAFRTRASAAIDGGATARARYDICSLLRTLTGSGFPL
jgi:hypothetical protein